MYCSNWETTGTSQRLQFLALAHLVRQRLGERLEIALGIFERGDAGTLTAFNQHFHGAVRQLQELQDRGNSADPVDVVRCRVVVRGVFLRHEQNLLVLLHHCFEGADGFFATDEERHDHVWKDNDIAQRQNRYKIGGRWAGLLPIAFSG